MNVKDYIRAKEEELMQWEKSIERSVANAADLDAWRARRDDAKKRVEELRADAGDRIDVLRMGVESAWAELKAAFETATGRAKTPPADRPSEHRV